MAEIPEEALKVIYQIGHIDSIYACRSEGCIVQSWAPAVAYRLAHNSKDLRQDSQSYELLSEPNLHWLEVLIHVCKQYKALTRWQRSASVSARSIPWHQGTVRVQDR